MKVILGVEHNNANAKKVQPLVQSKAKKSGTAGWESKRGSGTNLNGRGAEALEAEIYLGVIECKNKADRGRETE